MKHSVYTTINPDTLYEYVTFLCVFCTINDIPALMQRFQNAMTKNLMELSLDSITHFERDNYAVVFKLEHNVISSPSWAFDEIVQD